MIGENRDLTILEYISYDTALVNVDEGENTNSTFLKNFTLTGMNSDPQGRSAIEIQSGITLDNLIISGNHSPGNGPAIFINEDAAGSVIMKARQHWFTEDKIDD